MCLHSSCWKAAGMSLTKPHDLRGFDDGIVYVLYFFMAPIELVQWHPSNISMWVAWLFIVTVLVRSITFLHLLILIQLEYLLFTVAEEAKQMTLWLGLLNWHLHLTILLQKSESTGCCFEVLQSPPPFSATTTTTTNLSNIFQHLFDAIYGVCIYHSGPQSNKLLHW
jgi:hypothetical protein